MKQLLSHNDFAKHVSGALLDTNAVFLLANNYLMGTENSNLGAALMGFLERHCCMVRHETAVFGLDGDVYSRPAADDELYIEMPGPRKLNCTAGFSSLGLLKVVFQHALEMLHVGKPLLQVLSLHKFKLLHFSGTERIDRFAPSDSLYIGGLPWTATEADVSFLVETMLGRPPLRVIVRQKSPQSHKHSFVWVGDVVDAARCVKELNGKFFGPNRLMVNFAAPSKQVNRRFTFETAMPVEDDLRNRHSQQFHGSHSSAFGTPLLASSGMENIYQGAWYSPPVAPYFSMVMVPMHSSVTHSVQSGLPVAHIPFCMPPPTHSQAYAVGDFSLKSPGGSDSQSDVGSSEDTCSRSDDGSGEISTGSNSEGEEDDEEKSKEAPSAKKVVDETGTAALKALIGI